MSAAPRTAEAAWWFGGVGVGLVTITGPEGDETRPALFTADGVAYDLTNPEPLIAAINAAWTAWDHGLTPTPTPTPEPRSSTVSDLAVSQTFSARSGGLPLDDLDSDRHARSHEDPHGPGDRQDVHEQAASLEGRNDAAAQIQGVDAAVEGEALGSDVQSSGAHGDSSSSGLVGATEGRGDGPGAAEESRPAEDGAR